MRIATLLLIFMASTYSPMAFAQIPLPLEVSPIQPKREYHDIVLDPAEIAREAARIVPLDRSSLVFQGSTYCAGFHPVEEEIPTAHFAARNALALVEIVPAERMAYFTVYERIDLAVIGWSNYVSSVENAGGVQFVTVTVFPKLAYSKNFRVMVLDKLEEYYAIDHDGRVQYLGCRSAPDARRGQIMSF